MNSASDDLLAAAGSTRFGTILADPPWQFRGLVGDRAIFEGPDGESVLVAEGDRLGETLVTDISPTMVTLQYQGYEFLYDAPMRRGL